MMLEKNSKNDYLFVFFRLHFLNSVVGRGRGQCYKFNETHVPTSKKELKTIGILNLWIFINKRSERLG